MKINDFPLHIGVMPAPHNPSGLPDICPFDLRLDAQIGAVVQQVTPEVLGILQKAYRVGALIGTPLAGDSFGRPYADDFLHHISKLGLPRGAKALEIGAGVGYLTRRLKDAGLEIIGIEPGSGYAKYWKKNEVEIINDFFPTPHVTGRFDLIFGYAVLEHIAQPSDFLKHVRDCLTPAGVAVFAVPDCTDELLAGDPSILFHEHFTYFDAGSLRRLIEIAGMRSVVVKSGFGRCLYVTGTLRNLPSLQDQPGLAPEIIATYPERCSRFIARTRERISEMAAHGKLGVYCAARGLALLDRRLEISFFDDDPAQHGKFLPPFGAAILSRDALLSAPVDNLLIMSRTFGRRIKDGLLRQGYGRRIVTLDEM